MSKKYSFNNLSTALTSDDILGKEVIDKNGKFLGIVEKVFIDRKYLDFIGIEIDKGFLKKNLTIGKNYIKRVAENAIFLNISLANEIKGKYVFDKHGKKIGVISKVELIDGRNKIKYLYMKNFLKKEIKIPVDLVDRIEYNVFLKIDIRYLKKLEVV